MTEAPPRTLGWFDRAFVRMTTALKHIITPVNMWLLKVSRGRLGNSFLGVPVLLLHTVGSKTGLQRVTPLYYLEHQDRIILVASNGGNARDPAWVNNLKASPEAIVNIKGKEVKMHAHLADAEEFDRYWAMMTEMFFVWRGIQGKSTRRFPLAVLEHR